MNLNKNNEITHQFPQNRDPHLSPLPQNINSNIDSNKNKIEYLHKMLDQELSTVNSLFQKDNAFEKIEAKLKMLEVKLSSIKDENRPINSQLVIRGCENQGKRVSVEGSHAGEKMVVSKCLTDLQFQSLSKYKIEKKKSQIREETAEKSKSKFKSKESYFQYSHEGRKLNFDQNVQAQQERQTLKGYKKFKQSSSKKSMNIKAKSEKTLYRADKLSRPKSIKSKPSTEKKLQNVAAYQTISRQNSATKKRISISKTDQNQRGSSRKMLGESKTATNLHSWKDIAKIYHSTKGKREQQEIDKKSKVQQIIRKTEANRLQKELRDFRLKNEALQNQVAELKSYKSEFEKLKNIFQKDEKLRKSRKII